MQEPRCTLYVNGFPPDVLDREVGNLFRFAPGLVGYRVSETKKPPEAPTGEAIIKIAFVLFDSEMSADAAREALDGTHFDWRDAKSPLLRVSFARTNLSVHIAHDETRPRPLNPVRMQPGVYNPPPPVWRPPTSGYNPYAMATSGYSAGGGGAPYHPKKRKRAPGAGGDDKEGEAGPRGGTGGTPCATVYVSNLRENALDEEVHGIFSQLQGYIQMNIARKGGRAFVFVEYADIDSATKAIEQTNGRQLSSGTEEGGIAVSYSKNPYRASPHAAVFGAGGGGVGVGGVGAGGAGGAVGGANNGYGAVRM